MAKRSKARARAAKKAMDRLAADVGDALNQPFVKTPYERIAERVLAAVQELNDSLTEAHECAEMRVFMAATAKSASGPMRFNPQIYNLTHSTMTFVVKTADQGEQKPSWQVVKDPSFQDAAGQGLNALRKP